MHLTTLFVVNDEGAWMLRCPQDFSRDQAPGLIELAKAGQLEELYERTRVRIADHRSTYRAPCRTSLRSTRGPPT